VSRPANQGGLQGDLGLDGFGDEMAKTLRDYCRQVSTIARIVSTIRLPAAHWVPNDTFRQIRQVLNRPIPEPVRLGRPHEGSARRCLAHKQRDSS